MTTLVKDKVEIPKAFPVKKHTKYQILWLLKKKGPLTAWNLVDALEGKHVPKTHRTVITALHSLRKEFRVGIVNYTVEEKRQKEDQRSYGYYGYRKRSGGKLAGAKLGMQIEVEVWGLVDYTS